MISLRDYQQATVDHVMVSSGSPCCVLPTGAGKSIVVASLCKEILTANPMARIGVLTHVKEILAQNGSKLRSLWPGAPMGYYSASLGKRELEEPITFAGIQSIWNKEIEPLTHIIIDEVHTVNTKAEGRYRSFIDKHKGARVIGLTATPWRLGHGTITDGSELFDELYQPTSIEELVARGYLAPLRSKLTGLQVDVSGVKKRGGEYIESELAKAVDTEDYNQRAVDEMIQKGSERKHWLIFCVNIEHAEHVSQILTERGISSGVLTGKHTKKQREDTLSQFRAGEIRALCNVNVLTTGFDFPNIDLLGMLRPTMSPSLYVQICGRGMRPKDEADDCLVLDFVGLVRTHGPITAVQPPKKKGEKGGGEAPVKSCPECDELLLLSVRVCPSCGFEFEMKQQELTLRSDDIMGNDPLEMSVKEWSWRAQPRKADGVAMLRCDYFGILSDPIVSEYFPVGDPSGRGNWARKRVMDVAKRAGAVLGDNVESAAKSLQNANPPESIAFFAQGKFFRVVRKEWREE